MRSILLGVIAVLVGATAAGADDVRCLAVSGRVNTYCLEAFAAALERCRAAGDTACEELARGEDGVAARLLARTEPWLRAACDDAASETLGYVDADDVVKRAGEFCADFAEDYLTLGFVDDVTVLDPAALACQQATAGQLRWLRREIIRWFGPRCALRAYQGGVCARSRRNARLERLVAVARARIDAACGATFASLGLGPLDTVLENVATRARYFAIRAFPPNSNGPTGEFGPYPIGVTTLNLNDPSRMHVNGSGPRPVVTEVYYPSTAAAITGVPRDVVRVLGIPIVATPAYRDVDIAPGPFPIVLFSHGNGGIRFQSFFFAAHLASHGYIVVTPDHHGNTFVDIGARIVDANSAVNRPLDLSFLIDQFLAFNVEPGSRFEGAVQPDAIGAAGHSFGGFTVLLLAGPGGDPRIKAIVPQAPAAAFTDEFIQAITIPALIVGGSIDETTPFEANQQRPFDLLPSGATVVGLAELANAGHFTFSDFCEVDRNLLSFLGGFDEACEPRHLPWRHAHEIINYLSLNFFDATLLGDAEALARLSPDVLAGIDDLRWQHK